MCRSQNKTMDENSSLFPRKSKQTCNIFTHNLYLCFYIISIGSLLLLLWYVFHEKNSLVSENITSSISQNETKSTLLIHHDYNMQMMQQDFSISRSQTKEKWIYLIRHSEKHIDQDFGLSANGLAHSVCLVPYFKNFPLGIPQIAFAERSKEERAFQSLMPTSLLLNIRLKARWDKSQIHKFIDKIHLAATKKNSKYSIFLVAYEHHFLPYIAQKLGCTKCKSWNTNPLSNHTSGLIYNMTWVFSLTNFKHLYIYQQNYNSTNHSCTENIDYNYSKW